MNINREESTSVRPKTSDQKKTLVQPTTWTPRVWGLESKRYRPTFWIVVKISQIVFEFNERYIWTVKFEKFHGDLPGTVTLEDYETPQRSEMQTVRSRGRTLESLNETQVWTWWDLRRVHTFSLLGLRLECFLICRSITVLPIYTPHEFYVCRYASWTVGVREDFTGPRPTSKVSRGSRGETNKEVDVYELTSKGLRSVEVSYLLEWYSLRLHHKYLLTLVVCSSIYTSFYRSS